MECKSSRHRLHATLDYHENSKTLYNTYILIFNSLESLEFEFALIVNQIPITKTEFEKNQFHEV